MDLSHYYIGVFIVMSVFELGLAMKMAHVGTNEYLTHIEKVKDDILEKLGLDSPPKNDLSKNTDDFVKNLAEYADNDVVSELQKERHIIIAKQESQLPCLNAHCLRMIFEQNMAYKNVTSLSLMVKVKIKDSADVSTLKIQLQTTEGNFKTIKTFADSDWIKINLPMKDIKLTNHVLNLNIELKCQGCEISRRSKNSAFIYVSTEKKFRRRRNIRSVGSCSKSGGCCRSSYTVNFADLKWNWILAPSSYTSYYCSGSCEGPDVKIPYFQLFKKKTNSQVCCVPKKMSSLSIIYVDANNRPLKKDLPDMIVDKCWCA